MRVAGVDSCRGGWIAVTYDTDDRVLTPRVEVSFMALLERLRDAVAAAWTARRVVEGVAERLPAEPAVDRRGLRMEMVFRSIACMIPRTNTGGVELAYWQPVKSSMEIGVDFDWDPVKDRANEGKHGISFDDAKAVFLDAQHLIEDATRPEHGER